MLKHVETLLIDSSPLFRLTDAMIAEHYGKFQILKHRWGLSGEDPRGGKDPKAKRGTKGLLPLDSYR